MISTTQGSTQPPPTDYDSPTNIDSPNRSPNSHQNNDNSNNTTVTTYSFKLCRGSAKRIKFSDNINILHFITRKQNPSQQCIIDSGATHTSGMVPLFLFPLFQKPLTDIPPLRYTAVSLPSQTLHSLKTLPHILSIWIMVPWKLSQPTSGKTWSHPPPSHLMAIQQIHTPLGFPTMLTAQGNTTAISSKANSSTFPITPRNSTPQIEMVFSNNVTLSQTSTKYSFSLLIWASSAQAGQMQRWSLQHTTFLLY